MTGTDNTKDPRIKDETIHDNLLEQIPQMMQVEGLPDASLSLTGSTKDITPLPGLQAVARILARAALRAANVRGQEASL